MYEGISRFIQFVILQNRLQLLTAKSVIFTEVRVNFCKLVTKSWTCFLIHYLQQWNRQFLSMTEKILYYAETVGGEVPPAFPPLFTKISTNWRPSLYNWFNFWNGVIQLRQQDRVALSCGRSCQLANSVSTIIPKQSTMFLCLLSGNSYTVAYHYHHPSGTETL